MRHGVGVVGLVFALALVPAAEGAGTATNLHLRLAVGSTGRTAVIYPDGGTATVTSLKFGAGATVVNLGPESANFRIRFVLPAGLRWGLDEPDATENCTSTETEGVCTPPGILVPNSPTATAGWGWDIVASAPGTYVLRAEIVESSTSETDPSDNITTLNVVVSRPTATASAVQLVPAKPKAGSVVTARVRVTAGGEAATPSAVACSASLAGRKVAATHRATAGAAVCRFPTRSSARGKALRGSVAFAVNGTRITRRFNVMLR